MNWAAGCNMFAIPLAARVLALWASGCRLGVVGEWQLALEGVPRETSRRERHLAPGETQYLKP